MPSTQRTTSENPDFIALVKQLDAYLKKVDGDDHAFYNQFNSIENLNQVIVLYADEKAVACGAIKEFDNESMEVKRMYTARDSRGKGFATQVLNELEKWAAELGYTTCVLETGQEQKEAIQLYKKCGYSIIPNYGQYALVENSICFKKDI